MVESESRTRCFSYGGAVFPAFGASLPALVSVFARLQTEKLSRRFCVSLVAVPGASAGTGLRARSAHACKKRFKIMKCLLIIP